MANALNTMLAAGQQAAPAMPPPPRNAPTSGNDLLITAGASPALVTMLDERRAAHSRLLDTALTETSEINDERKRIGEEIDQISDGRPAPPEAPEYPEAPPQTMPGNGARVYGQFLPVLAMLGGFFVNRDATAALRTGAAAMRAARANDAQELALQHQHWEDQIERLTSQRQADLAEYQAILQDNSASLQEKMAQLSALAARENNFQIRAQISAGDIAGIQGNIETQIRANTAIRQQIAADRAATSRGRGAARGGSGAPGGGALESQITAAGNVLSAIDRATALAEEDRGTTGLQGQVFRGIGGNRARDLDALVDTIASNIGFDRLQEMRNNSPTGGALGSITERELALLQSVISSLDTSQSQEQFLDNLARVRTQYVASMRAMYNAYVSDVNAGLINPDEFYTDIFSAAGLGGPSGEGGGGDVGGADDEMAPTITTQEEFDALPSGSPFYDSQGNYAVKP